MQIEPLVRRMEHQAEGIRGLFQAVPPEQLRWRPRRGAWSALEVLGHLWDEERLDFRVRLDFTLHRRGEPWPPIDPVASVRDGDYRKEDPEALLSRFLEERRRSAEWLRGLVDPDWEAHHDASFGRMRAGDVMASWVAHDLLHMRQWLRIQWEFHSREIEPFGVDYAGSW